MAFPVVMDRVVKVAAARLALLPVEAVEVKAGRMAVLDQPFSIFLELMVFPAASVAAQRRRMDSRVA
jgi:hypothetical protein